MIIDIYDFIQNISEFFLWLKGITAIESVPNRCLILVHHTNYPIAGGLRNQRSISYYSYKVETK